MAHLTTQTGEPLVMFILKQMISQLPTGTLDRKSIANAVYKVMTISRTDAGNQVSAVATNHWVQLRAAWTAYTRTLRGQSFDAVAAGIQVASGVTHRRAQMYTDLLTGQSVIRQVRTPSSLHLEVYRKMVSTHRREDIIAEFMARFNISQGTARNSYYKCAAIPLWA